MIVLLGRTCAGKDSVARELIKLGCKRVITYTTRPIREKEVNHVDYHFITEEDFLLKIDSGFFAEYKVYSTVVGNWYYGSAKEDYTDNNTQIILTPSGLEEIKNQNLETCSFYINTNDDVIKKRQVQRGDSEDEALRRFNSDLIDFENADKISDYVINNYYNFYRPEEVAQYIMHIVKERSKEKWN